MKEYEYFKDFWYILPDCFYRTLFHFIFFLYLIISLSLSLYEKIKAWWLFSCPEEEFVFPETMWVLISTLGTHPNVPDKMQ